MDWISLGIKLLKYDPSFELRVILLASLFILIPMVNVLYFLLLKQLPETSKIRKNLLKVGSGTFNIIGWSLFGIIILASIIIRPFIVNITPSVEEGIRSATPKFLVEFDMPVSKASLKFNLSPELKGEWKPLYIPGTKWARKYEFVPEESIYPGNPVVVYVTGIKTPWSIGKKHEQAMEYKRIEIPKVVASTPADKAINIRTSTDLVFTLNEATGAFIKWDIVADPAIEKYKIVNHGKNLRVSFEEELQQDQKYIIKLYRTPRSYNIQTGEDLKVGDTEEVNSIEFTTVSTPLVKEYTPKGDAVLANSEIKVVFDQEMEMADVESNLKIEPELKGTFEWSDATTMIYKTESALAKGTKYTISLPAGVHSKASGVTKEPIAITFTTIGAIKVKSVTPINGSTGNAVTGTSIVVLFDQKVDHSSAQSKFSLIPTATGSFSWSGNQMTFKPTAALKYGTKYTINLAKGIKSIDGIDSDKTYSYTFTTRQQIVKLNVPWYAQSEGFTCNIAATRMVLAYRGIYKTENQIRSSIGYGQNPNISWVDGYGVHAAPINSYISGFRGTNYKTGMSIAQLTAEIDAGHPVITWVYNRYSTPYGSFTLPGGYTGYMGMHSEVVTGYSGDPKNPTYIYTNDPWRGHLTYSQATFKSIWSYLGYTGVAVK